MFFAILYAMNSSRPYIGRYAPSPTGDLHLGNLRTALLAWLHARLQGGKFLLRMEDLDTPRVVTGSAERILADLEWLGLDWDDGVIYQSQRQDYYESALEQLHRQDLIYPCYCSRKDIRQAASAPHQSPGVYPGSCRNLSTQQCASLLADKPPALRIKVGGANISFNDICEGPQVQQLSSEVGDFVVKRADGLFAYQLAVVVDDLDCGITDVVRGADLLDSAARQIYLAEMLSAEECAIRYCHVPLMLDEQGGRMAKRDGSFSASEWRDSGRNAEQLVAELAVGIGLIRNVDSISGPDLLESISLEALILALDKNTNM